MLSTAISLTYILLALIRSKQPCRTQERQHSGFDIPIIRPHNGRPGYQNDIPSRRDEVKMQPYHFAKEPLYPVTHHRVPDSLAHRKTKAAVLQIAPTLAKYYHPIRVTAPLTVDTAEIGRFGEAVLLR